MGLREMLAKMTGTFSRKQVGTATAPCPGAMPVIHIVDDRGRPNTRSAQVESRVEVSNLVSNVDLPTGFLDPSNDRDNFKIEVIDSTLTGSNTIPASQVDLEVRRPDGSAFSPARKIQVELQRIAGSNIFRSRYIRAVVDQVDLAACPANQRILTDWDPTQPSLNILGQIVRATYRSATCGVVQWEATVGNDRRMLIRVAVHIVRGSPGGPPVVTVAAATERINEWYRRLYAQISMAPLLLQIREVDPPENLVSISNDWGARADGGGTITFTIQAGVGPGAKTQMVSVTTRRRDKPINTANHLAAAIRTQAKFNVRVVENPSLLNIGDRSADLIITDPAGARVVITAENSTDTAQTIDVGRVVVNPFEEWALSNKQDVVVGSLQQRCLLQNYDSGQDRIDLFVIERFNDSNLHGAAMLNGEYYRVPRSKWALREVVMSAFVDRVSMDASDDYSTVNAHESAHVLMEHLHAAVNTEFMFAYVVAGMVVGGAKRMSEGDLSFEQPYTSSTGVVLYETINAVQRIRTKGRRVLAPFR